MTHNQIREKLLSSVGGMEKFKGGWSWRSFDPEKRADEALIGAITACQSGIRDLENHGATDEQKDRWVDIFVKKWSVYMAAGARTANPMITGPANFPADRNRKRMETERKRMDEYALHANGAPQWMHRQKRSADRADLSKKASGVDHKTQQFGDVKVVYNKVLDRLQLVFPEKPSDDQRAILKKAAFRWSPRENAWQRKLTQNAVSAAERFLRQAGYIDG